MTGSRFEWRDGGVYDNDRFRVVGDAELIVLLNGLHDASRRERGLVEFVVEALDFWSRDDVRDMPDIDVFDAGVKLTGYRGPGKKPSGPDNASDLDMAMAAVSRITDAVDDDAAVIRDIVAGSQNPGPGSPADGSVDKDAWERLRDFSQALEKLSRCQ